MKSQTVLGMLAVMLMMSYMMVQVTGHAVMKSPVPFNTNPTTTRACGVASITNAMASTAQATWKKGSNAYIVWNLVASDGGGNLIGEFDPLGGTDFTVSAWTADYPTTGSNKIYNKSFVVPSDLDCSQSPTGLCTFRVRSSSNWYSCTMVKICGADCVVTPPPPTVCSKVTSPLTFCPSSDGVSISEGYSANDIDNSVASTYAANLANPNVFTTPKGSGCEAQYKTLLCGLSLPPCNPTTKALTSPACRSQCKTAMKSCSVTTVHETLYNCDALPLCDGESEKSSSGGGMSAGGAAALSIFLIALVGSLAFAGYMYHKQGHLFGYTFDKDAKRVVKVQANPHNYTAYVDSEYKI